MSEPHRCPQTRRQQFEEQWLADHGPGSWDGWGWVVRMEVA